MIFVKEYSDDSFAVQFKPVQSNLNRIRQIPGAKFDGNKSWIIPITYLDIFERDFKGEFIYLTPRHILRDEAPPPPPKMYEKIPKENPAGIIQPYSLYDYQRFGANFLACIAAGTGHAFLIDAVGTGKTLQSIAAAQLLEQQGKADTVFVFCKASLKYQWLRDGIEKFTNDKGIVIDGTKKQRESQWLESHDPKYKYVIVNYELLLHDFDYMKECVKKKNIRLLVADEAHRVVNHKGKMNNALAKLVQEKKKPKYKGIEHVFFLTATPLSSKIEQLYGLFSIRRPDYFGKFTDFSRQYLKWNYNGRHTELVGYQNLDEIREKTWKFMLRRSDKEIDMELPDLVEMFRKVEFTPLQKKLDSLALSKLEEVSQKLEAARRAKLPDEKIESLEGSSKALMYVRKAICDSPELLTRGNSKVVKDFIPIIQSHKDKDKSPKIDELFELIDEMVVEGNEKLIIFTEYETMLQILKEKIESKKKIQCAEYSGKLNTKQKDESIQRFKEDDDCRILLATDAGAEGLNLQHAPYLINFDLPWNPDILTQRNGRIRRGGSTFEKVKVINLMAPEGIDKSVWEAIQNKQNLFNYMVENTAEQSQALKEAMYGKQ